MKERRRSGATHSFRLTMAAAEIVDNIHYPRRLGGKSRRVSEAIEWYFSKDRESLQDLTASRQWWMQRYEDLNKAQSAPKLPAWWRRFLPKR